MMTRPFVPPGPHARQVMAERVVLALALGALSAVPGRGGAHAVLCADTAAVAAKLSTEEGEEKVVATWGGTG